MLQLKHLVTAICKIDIDLHKINVENQRYLAFQIIGMVVYAICFYRASDVQFHKQAKEQNQNTLMSYFTDVCKIQY